MSRNSTSSDFYAKANFMQRHVGGKHTPRNNQEYIETQHEILRNADQRLPPNVRQNSQFRYNITGDGKVVGGNVVYNENESVQPSQKFPNIGLPSVKSSTNTTTRNVPARADIYMRQDDDRYDPYIGFLYKKGLLDDGRQKRRFRTQFINVDSRFRTKQPTQDLDEPFILENNPLDFNIRSKTVFVRHPNHPYEVGDLITMQNVLGSNVILRTFRDIDPDFPEEDSEVSFIIPRGCNVMKIIYPTGLPRGTTATTRVQIEGVKGDRGNVNNVSFLGNIPINLINTTHDIILEVSPDDTRLICDENLVDPTFFNYGAGHFFVFLDKAMHLQVPPYTLREYNYKLIFQSVSGVPLSELNAFYPISANNINGFHILRSVNSNGYTFNVNTEAILDENGGGKCVTVSKVLAVNTGYPSANNYRIDLGITYNNIISLKLASSEFPNSERTIRDFPPERANNKIYWNDIDDGEFLYSIEVPAGNYTPTDLINTLQTLFFETPRINSGQDIGANYQPNHFVQVNISTVTDEVTFQSFKEFILVQPISSVNPEINQNANIGADDPNAIYTLTINHPGHGMSAPGLTILWQDAISHLGIPAGVLNTTHIVSEIVDANTYRFVLPKFNLGDNRQDTKGGTAVRVLIPDFFRLRFDQPDTLGGLLGFRNPGDPNSITPYEHIVSNQDPYAFDIDRDILGNPLRITNNSIQLSGENYVLMTMSPVEALQNIGPIKSAFAKLQLCDLAGKVLFNTYSCTPRFYEDPIVELSELEVQFYTPDGFLYDFNGLDHSFLLEIVTVNDIPEGTGISAETGKNYNLDA